MIKLNVKKLDKSAILPKYATSGAACFDLHALESQEIDQLGGVRQCKTGLAFEIPAGYVMLVYSRSGHGFKNRVSLVNSVGVIDSDYRGEVIIGLRNDSAIRFNINAGDRIAQAMIIPVPLVHISEVSDLSETDRGAGGFGSTGG